MPLRVFNSLVALFGLFLPAPVVASQPTGEEIYRTLCADCHGVGGQGADAYERPLSGDLTVGQLASVIDKTMPEGEPERCASDDAHAVAAYVHDAFYSPKARARLRPPRIELSRLTARQLEQSVVDLALSFTWRGKIDQRRGLTQECYRGRWVDKKKRVSDQVVPVVDFHLLDSGLYEKDYLFPPDKSKLPKDPIPRANAQAAHVVWHGGVLAPESGVYEFIVETNSGFTLRVNGGEPIIDNRVQSGDERGGRAKVRLVEGRAYPLRLAVTRIYEDDMHARLLWRTPSGAEQPVPSHALLPHNYAQLLRFEAVLPPDDRSMGFLRGSNVSNGWDEAATRLVLEVADWLIEFAPKGLKLPGDPAKAHQAARGFCHDFAERAFRRPLTKEEQARFVDGYFDNTDQWEAAVKPSLVRVLKSPYFLYPEVSVAESSIQWQRASRLALALWDSIPDKPLNLLARKEGLASRDQVRRQAKWMLRDPRAESKLMGFFREWLHIGPPNGLSRDPKLFEGFDQQVATDMRASLELMLHDIAFSEEGDYRRFFTTDEIYVNPRLAEFLGLNPPGEQGFVRRKFETVHRSGVVTHPYVVASHAYFRDTSPIHRGVFLARHVLGRALQPPPVAVAPIPPESQPNMTTRQRVALQTSPTACQNCHVLINDLGFSLEHFDAVGRFRKDESGRPIDTSGSYTTLSGEERRFADARELAQFIAESHDAQRAFVVQLFEHLAKQPIRAYGAETEERLWGYFKSNEFNIQKLMAEIATTIAMADPTDSTKQQTGS